ncbi:uncharacterized protein BP5553_01712 [Venustampulla echinocandica]|uniref:Ecp2 effector protein domain-containing protein n=1 Tax=Venustampulla echinocandica TaxID=2656787 RepID=A0A370U1W2_9HELO|nr:uncharacterized protein BP5553_01712 [Venustampulla echinocandica]RDL41733.1 hypothetical protein BP5553_01712 [Venustampulla echinocandica]
MHFLTIGSLSCMAALALAAPTVSTTSNADLAERFTFEDYSGTSSADDKREITFEDYSGTLSNADKRSPDVLEARKSSHISSCGDNWMPIKDTYSPAGSGYESAVNAWCYHITHPMDDTPSIIPPKGILGSRIAGGFFLKGHVPGVVDFEIHNKKSNGEHKPDEGNCKNYLMQMATKGNKCYGSKNIDTKGGTYQVEGDGEISYHALPRAA